MKSLVFEQCRVCNGTGELNKFECIHCEGLTGHYYSLPLLFSYPPIGFYLLTYWLYRWWRDWNNDINIEFVGQETDTAFMMPND